MGGGRVAIPLVITRSNYTPTPSTFAPFSTLHRRCAKHPWHVGRRAYDQRMKKWFAAIAAVVAVAGVAGCGSDSQGDARATSSSAAPSTMATTPGGFYKDALSLSEGLTDAGFFCIPDGQTTTAKSSIASCTFASDGAGIDVSIIVWPKIDDATKGIDAMLRVAIDNTQTDPDYGPGKNFVQGVNWLLSLGHNMVAAGQVVGQFGGSGVRVKQGEIVQF